MSYKALYRTYRPKTFDDVVGQEHIISTLKNIILNEKVSHAYLFSGPRGTGKTSTAHIFANTLNCSDNQNPTSPCWKCKQCLEIKRGNMDVVELDAASNNGVGEIRNLIENSKYAPNISKYKVYIIDEVHMLSKGAFNALLKTLEEPPQHVIFILATTEPHKIPVTILSRIQRFNFRRISTNAITKRVKYVLEQEKLEIEDEALELIAYICNGGMRDALSMVDQASSYAENKISFKSLSEIFGVVSIVEQIKILNNSAKKDSKSVLLSIQKFINNGIDIKRLTESLLSILRDFIIFEKTKDISLLDILRDKALNEIAFSVDFAYYATDILMKLLSDLRISEVPKQTFELAILRLVEVETKFDTSPRKKSKKAEAPKEPEIKSSTELEESQLDVIERNIFKAADKEIEEQIKEADEDTLDESKDEIKDQLKDIKIETKKLESTDEIEINIDSMFEIGEKNEIVSDSDDHKKIRFEVDEIINLLVQANRQFLVECKKSFQNLSSFVTIEEYTSYIVLLESTKLISAGKEFVLLTSELNDVVESINEVRKEPKFIELVNSVFGKPLLIFTITKQEFEAIKNKWAFLSQTSSLPEPQEIEKLEIKIEETSEIEEYGAEIFGETLK